MGHIMNFSFWPSRKKDILDEIFGFERLTELKQKVAEVTGEDP